MYLTLALVFFALFVGHVLIGSMTGQSLVGDVGEMLILFCSSIAFVVAILRAEEKAKSQSQSS